MTDKINVTSLPNINNNNTINHNNNATQQQDKLLQQYMNNYQNTTKYKYCMMCGGRLVYKLDNNNVKRLSCSNIDNNQCNFVFYNNPVVVVAAIIEHKQNKDDNNEQPHIILARNINWPLNWFGLITGFLESNETVIDGLLREVKEEVGLDSYQPELIGIYDFIKANQVIIAYSVKAHGKIVLDKTELAEYKLVPVNELMYWPEGTGLAVRDYLINNGIKQPQMIRTGRRRNNSSSHKNNTNSNTLDSKL